MAMPENHLNQINPNTNRHLYNGLDWLATVLLIIGGINWGAIGLFNTNLVALLVGDMTTAARAVYILVGLSAVYSIYLAGRVNRRIGEHDRAPLEQTTVRQQ